MEPDGDIGAIRPDPAQAARFHAFLNWFIWIFWVFIPLDAGAAIYTQNAASSGLAATLVLIQGALYAARGALRAGNVDRAVTVATGALLAPIPFLALFRPDLFPVIAAGSMLSVAAVLPFVSFQRLRRHAAAAAGLALVVIVMGVVMTDPAPNHRSPLFSEATFALSLAFVIGITLLMLVKFSGRLRDTLQETTIAHARLEAAVEELRQLDQMKTQFMNNAAHELNTPLTPLRLQLHILRVRGDDMPAGDRERAMGILDRSVARMERLVRDLLDGSRLQAGRLRLEPERVELGAVVAERIESFQAAGEQAGVHVEVGFTELAPVWGDSHRLGQILDVFLNNSLKFTPRGGKVRVSMNGGAEAAVVRVEDTGVGIEQVDLAKLFRPFSQVGTGPHTRGTGLGLFIAKGIAEQHGGRVWAESAGAGRGSTFCMAIPRLATLFHDEMPLVVATGPSGPTGR